MPLFNQKYLRNKSIYQIIVAFVCVIFFTSGADARHIIGGDITYRCVRDLGSRVEYEVILTMYRDDSDPNASDFDNQIAFGIFRGFDGNWQPAGAENVRLESEQRVIPVSPSPCLTIPSFNIWRGVYRFNITLQKIDENYMFAYQRCCRNNTISNILDPGDQGAAFFAILTAAGQRVCNNSPVFNDFPPIVICANFDVNFDHGANDAESDQLSYSFCAPKSAGGQGGTRQGDPPGAAEACDGVTPNPNNCGPNLFRDVTFRTPLFTAANPLSGSPVVSIDNQTGLISGKPNLTGQYVVGVCVQEFRNGELMGEIRRDFQFNVENCTVNVQVDIDADLLAPKQWELRSCGESNITINNLSQDERSIFNYDWDFDIAGNQVVSTVRNPTIDFGGEGTYQGRLILNKNDTICADTGFITVRVFPPTEADFTLDYDTCIAGPVTFTDLSTTGSTGITDWDWSFGDDDMSVVQNPIHSYQRPGEFTTQLVVTDVNNCQDSLEQTFLWAPVPPLVVVEPSTFIGCAPSFVSFNNLSSPIDNTYDIRWTLGDGTTSDEISPTHFYENPGVYDVSVEITSPFGCSIAKNYPNWITLRQKPEADFVFDPENPSVFNPTVSFTDQSVDAIRWLWDFDGQDFSNIQNPTYTFPDTGIFDIQLVVTHPSGCTDTATTRVDILPVVTLFFPNAFTPNSDGLNEKFVGVGYKVGIRNYLLQIWNRWGEKIFESTDPDEGWNGTFENNGGNVQEGVYVYTVRYVTPRGESLEEKGRVNVIR